MRKVTFQLIARALLRKHNVRSIRSIHLAQALSRGQLRVFQAGEVLCQEGDSSDEMFVIAQGEVQVLRNNPHGTPTEFIRIQGPSLIGQMGLIDGSQRSATCITTEKTTLIIFSKVRFERLMNERTINGAAFRHQVMFTMMNQLSHTNQKIEVLLEEA